MQDYQAAFEEFKKLPHVDSDQLDGTIDHLVFRAQHELDIWSEGEWPDDLSFTAAQRRKIAAFIKKYGNQKDLAWTKEHTPQFA